MRLDPGEGRRRKRFSRKEGRKIFNNSHLDRNRVAVVRATVDLGERSIS